MTPVIRSATPDDLSTLVEIEQQSFSHPHWDRESFLRYRCKIAEIDGRIAGFVVSRQTFAGDRHAVPEREILNIAVAAPYRRMGIATVLLLDELSEQAVYFLEVRESNTAAQALYRKMGFVQVASRPEYYECPRERAIVMQMK